MKIEVFNEESIKCFETYEPHILISVRSPKTDIPTFPYLDSRLATFYLSFSDLDQNIPALKGIRLFTPEQACNILVFMETWKSYIRLICVNCEAGISRSSAIAGALSHIINGSKSDQYFFDNYLPNSLVYKTILTEYYKQFLAK